MIKKLGFRLFALLTALLIITGGAGLAWLMHAGASHLPLRQYFPRNYTNAVWDWSNPLNKTPSDLDRIATFMYLHQLNTVYVDIGQYTAINNGKASQKEKATKIHQLDEAMVRYISALQKRNIQVIAAAGDVTWSQPDQWGKPLSILEAVHQFNNAHPNTRFAGMEFDVESYNQPGFEEGSVTVKTLILTDYLNMVDMLANKTSAYTHDSKQPFELGFAIPYWFDNENGNIPSVTWQGKTGPTLYHLLDRLNQLPKSNVSVMAYRNAARGNDGMIYHSRTEIEYARAKAPRVAIIIGQEVNDVEPAKITFYGKSSTELSSQVKIVVDEFNASGTLGGIAINDLAGFEEMEQSN
jgi:hypothetical protein